jgi:hypothetical protein
LYILGTAAAEAWRTVEYLPEGSSWLRVFATAARQPLVFAIAVFLTGSVVYLLRAKKRGEWPFTNKPAFPRTP